MLTLFLATVLASPTADAQAEIAAPDTGRVVQVYDGDTLTLESVTAFGALGQHAGSARRRTTAWRLEKPPRRSSSARRSRLVFGKVKRDGYGRLIAGVEVDGTDLSTHLLSSALLTSSSFRLMTLTRRSAGCANESAGRLSRNWSTERYEGVLPSPASTRRRWR